MSYIRLTMSSTQKHHFLTACRKGDTTTLEALLREGFDPHYSTVKGPHCEGAMLAIRNYHPDVLSTLFSYGLRIDHWYTVILTLVDTNTCRPTSEDSKALSTILFILNHYGSTLNETDESGNTVLWECVGSKSACTMAIQLGVNPRIRNKKGQIAYHYALELINKEIESQRVGIDYNPQDFDLKIRGYNESLDVLRVK